MPNCAIFNIFYSHRIQNIFKPVKNPKYWNQNIIKFFAGLEKGLPIKRYQSEFNQILYLKVFQHCPSNKVISFANYRTIMVKTENSTLAPLRTLAPLYSIFFTSQTVKIIWT